MDDVNKAHHKPIASRIRKTAWAFLFVTGSMLVAGVASLAAPPTNQTVLKCEYSTNKTGEIHVWIGANVLRIDFDLTRAHLVAKAPDWSVMVWNSQTKNALKMSYEEWIKHHTQWIYLSEDWPGHSPVLKKGTTVVHGLKCINFEIADFSDRTGKLIRRVWNIPSDYAVATDTIAAEKACHIFERTINAPQAAGLPVMLVFSAQNESKAVGMRLGKKDSSSGHFSQFDLYDNQQGA